MAPLVEARTVGTMIVHASMSGQPPQQPVTLGDELRNEHYY
jgi:hypothetical protein